MTSRTIQFETAFTILPQRMAAESALFMVKQTIIELDANGKRAAFWRALIQVIDC